MSPFRGPCEEQTQAGWGRSSDKVTGSSTAKGHDGWLPGSHLGLLEPVQARWKSTSLDLFALSLLMLCTSPSEAGEGALCTLSPEHTARGLW